MLLALIEYGESLFIPSASVTAICPVIAPPSSSPVPDDPPVTTVGSVSYTHLTLPTKA